MVDSEYSTHNYLKVFKNKYWNINSNPKMLTFILHYLKTKKMGKNAIKKVLFVKRYVCNQYNTQTMCDEAIEEH